MTKPSQAHCRSARSSIVATTLLVLLSARLLGAQLQLARIEGRVVDPTGQPISAATVSLTDPLGAELPAAVTSADGRFLLLDVVPGRYTLRTWPAGEQFAKIQGRQDVQRDGS
jgi:Carboxypeptidase regulatory-like domain